MSFSVPTSPAMSRSVKAQPVTPQRLPRQQPRSQSYYRSPLTPPSTSPYTPLSLRSLDSTGSSTLTTPDSLGIGVKKRLAFSTASPEVVRNVNAAQDKSVADIAENWRSRASENGIKVAFASQNDSSYCPDNSSDMSFSDAANNSSVVTTEEALLAPAFLSTHRRLNSLPNTGRPRAQSHVPLPPSRVHPSSPLTSRNTHRAPTISSPLQSRRTASLNQSMNLMSTPPPNRGLARQLKLKGSLTDPAQPRRREVLGNVPPGSNNIGYRHSNMSLTLEPDTSLDLFDIDENEFEHEATYQELEEANFFAPNLQTLQTNTFGYPSFALRHQQGQLPVFNQPTFMDPFQPHGSSNGLLSGRILNGIAESVEHHFQATRQQPQNPFYEDNRQARQVFYAPVANLQPQFNQGMHQSYPTPAYVPVPQPSLLSFQPLTTAQPNAAAELSFSSSSSKIGPCVVAPEINPTDCSVCLASHPSSLAILQPCRHPLCSACLTSALNIVGEKDMECAVCKQSVADFKLVMGSSKGDKSESSDASASVVRPDEDVDGLQASEKNFADPSNLTGKSFIEPLFSSPHGSSNALDHAGGNGENDDLESAFEFGLDLGELRASTPRLEQQSQEYSTEGTSRSYGPKRDIRRGEDNVVLRIDNVPWDITPLQIIRWLQQPVERVHVLLDSKGKTLSHAYVEAKDASTAGAILRGEAIPSPSSNKKERGSVLGRGRRARGVTVTRSGQQELMSDLFPHWLGGFDGSRPSLAGLEGERVIGALEGGLLTESEISGLLYLIREPDSHFLKVPSLPFHSLISILSKFPTDVDSRVFWSINVRDMLFDMTYTAVQVLVKRIDNVKQASRPPAGQEDEYTMDLVIDLLHTAIRFKAFTEHQIQRLIDLAQACSVPLPENDTLSVSYSSDFSSSSSLKTPSSQDPSTTIFNHYLANKSQVHGRNGSLNELAKEFGIDEEVVQALAHRLAKMS